MRCLAVLLAFVAAGGHGFDDHAADEQLRTLEANAGILTDRDRELRPQARRTREMGESRHKLQRTAAPSSDAAMDRMLHRLVKRVGHRVESTSSLGEQGHRGAGKPAAGKAARAGTRRASPNKVGDARQADNKAPTSTAAKTSAGPDGIPTMVCNQPASKEKGVVRGQVRHAGTGKPLQDVQLTFEHSQGRCVARTDRDGEFKVTMEVWSTERAHPHRKIKFSKPGFYKTTATVGVRANAVHWVPTFEMVPEVATKPTELGDTAKTGTGRVSGRLLSSATGTPLKLSCCTVCNAIMLHFRPGVDNQQGQPVLSHTADNKGSFDVSGLSAGAYTMEVDAPCYVRYHATVAVIPQKLKLYRQIVMAPSFGRYDGVNKLRFVLTWSKQPDDLSMHLLMSNKAKTWSEVATEQTTNHVANFKQRIYNGHGFKIVSKGKGTLTDEPFAQMTHDSKQGYGPDELVVSQPKANTKYTLYVERIGDQMTSLQKSGAKVEVYRNDDLIDTIVAPSNGDSMTRNFWNVMDFHVVDDVSIPIADAVKTKVTNKIVRREPPQGALV